MFGKKSLRLDSCYCDVRRRTWWACSTSLVQSTTRVTVTCFQCGRLVASPSYMLIGHLLLAAAEAVEFASLDTHRLSVCVWQTASQLPLELQVAETNNCDWQNQLPFENDTLSRLSTHLHLFYLSFIWQQLKQYDALPCLPVGGSENGLFHRMKKTT